MRSRRLKQTKSILLAVTSCVLASIVFAQPDPAIEPNAIDRYVDKRDRAFEWQTVQIIKRVGYDVIAIDMTSQRWLNEDIVDRPLWQHRLILTIPERINPSGTAFLYISSGSNNEEPRTSSNDLVTQIALGANMVVAELRQVPNQPLVFQGDGQPRYEDDLIAYTWVQYLETGEPLWLARNPMIKSAVRAMDVISAFMKRHLDGQYPIKDFVVGGGSKRGWTTWMTGAMDERVVGIVPIVIDVLNVERSMQHHFDAYGFWAPSIGDYVRHGITQRMGSAELKRLYNLTDPMAYVHRLAMPKFVVNATGDQFFLPDSSQFYWNALPGGKWLRYVPNADHGLGNSDAGESIAAFLFALTHDVELPTLTWTYPNDHQIDMTFSSKPIGVEVWQATNLETRDFRLETFGAGYAATAYDLAEIQPNEPTRFSVATPNKGWTAWFVSASFEIGFARPLTLTSEVRVTPNSLPFAGKDRTLPLSLTFVLYDVETDANFYEETVQAVQTSGVGGNVSITSQANRTYINFTPIREPRLALGAFMQFLRSKFGDDFKGALQLESGFSATIAPGLR
ncbi:MAG: PhoPQ-activated pathogenicity [Gammaproteobacteria bacterium]|nr:PhoPQ-activated pathogenicity [Gammaproteobacteria bacterium]